MQSPAQVTGDLPEPAPLSPQGMDQVVLAPCGLGELPCRVRRPGVRLPRRFRFRDGRGGLGQAGAMRGNALLGGGGEVLPQVEPVGDLDRLRRPGAGAV